VTKALKESPLGRGAGASEHPPSISKMEGYLHLPSNSKLPGIRTQASRPAIFLDRDGVLVKDVHYLSSPSQLRLLPGVAAGLRALQDRFFVIVATNQSGIARGFLTEEDLMTIHVELVRLLAAEGVRLDALYYCPHLPEAVVPEYGIRCDCRKPQPAMLLRAADDWRIDLSESFLVGDSPRDIEAAHGAGVKGIMVVEEDGRYVDQQAPVVPNLAAAARMILGEDFPPGEAPYWHDPAPEASL